MENSTGRQTADQITDKSAQQLPPISLGLSVGPVVNGDITVSLVSPSGRRKTATATAIAIDGESEGEGDAPTRRLFLQPDEPGCHEMRLLETSGGRELIGSPFYLRVGEGDGDGAEKYNESRCPLPACQGCDVRSLSPGAGSLWLVLEIRVNKNMTLAIDTDGNDPVFQAEDVKDVPSHRQQQQQQGQRDVVPLEPGDYTLALKIFDADNTNFANIRQQGGPMIFKVISMLSGVKQLAIVGRGKRLRLPVWLADATAGGELTATVTGPAGDFRPCPLRRQPNGRFAVAVSPSHAGRHQVRIEGNDKTTGQSPFSRSFDIDIAPGDIADASKVKLTGIGDGEFLQRRFYAGRRYRFDADVSNAGYGRLAVTLTGPGRARIDVEGGNGESCGKGGLCRISYLARMPGQYALSVLYGGRHVTESPWNIIFFPPEIAVTDASSPIPKPLTDAENVAEESIEADSLSGGEDSDSGRGCSTELKPRLRASASGPGLLHGLVNQPNRILIVFADSSQSSPSTSSDLAVVVEGPSKALLSASDPIGGGSGGCEVDWTVPRPGVYRVGIGINGCHVDGSPRLVRIYDVGDYDLNYQNESSGVKFDGNEKYTHSDGGTKFSGVCVNSKVREMCPKLVGSERWYTNVDGDHQFADVNVEKQYTNLDGERRYTHFDSESQYSNVDSERQYSNFDGERNYFGIDVDEKYVDVVDVGPKRLLCRCPSPRIFGAALNDASTSSQIVVGSPSRFRLLACRRRVGVVAVSLDGPAKCRRLMASKIEEAAECAVCYEFVYSLELAGRYTVRVRCGLDEDHLWHVKGSPFYMEVLAVSASPSAVAASRIVCSGCGLRDATEFQTSVVTVDARAAGVGTLRADLLEASGRPAGAVVEVRRLASAGVFSVAFQPLQAGPHWLSIAWDGCHVTGSPYAVLVASDSLKPTVTNSMMS